MIVGEFSNRKICAGGTTRYRQAVNCRRYSCDANSSEKTDSDAIGSQSVLHRFMATVSIALVSAGEVQLKNYFLEAGLYPGEFFRPVKCY